MTRSRPNAEATSGLLSCTHDPERCASLGGVTMPLGQEAATVKPLCGGSGWVVRNAMVPGRWAMTSASVPVGALRPRIDSTAQERDRRGQRDPRFGLVDPE